MNTYVLGNMILTIYSLIKRNKDKSINCTNIQLGVPVLEYLQEYRWRITYRGRDALRPTASLKISYQHEWPLKKAATLGSLLQGLFIGSASIRRGPGKSWILRIYWKHEVYFLDLMSCSTPSLRECFNYEEIAIHFCIYTSRNNFTNEYQYEVDFKCFDSWKGQLDHRHPF